MQLHRSASHAGKGSLGIFLSASRKRLPAIVFTASHAFSSCVIEVARQGFLAATAFLAGFFSAFAPFEPKVPGFAVADLRLMKKKQIATRNTMPMARIVILPPGNI
jgi:hypothetical protein